jgi:hypothetical protein
MDAMAKCGLPRLEAISSSPPFLKPRRKSLVAAALFFCQLPLTMMSVRKRKSPEMDIVTGNRNAQALDLFVICHTPGPRRKEGSSSKRSQHSMG